MRKIFLLLFSVTVIAGSMLTSCISQKKILYLQHEMLLNDSTTTSIIYDNQRHFDYKVQPGDNLNVKVACLDERFASYFNSMSQGNSGGSSGGAIGNSSLYLSGYNVSEDGFIELPIVGEVLVKDMTVAEIQDKVQALLNEYIKETTVSVKLGIFNLTILGEVNKPGVYQVCQSDINIFQAIALAGNATDFANKSNIKIVHQTPEGSQIVKINIKDADVLSSPEYYLRPNDIIYVEPLKAKQYGFTTLPYGTIFSVVSLLMTCITFGFMFVKK